MISYYPLKYSASMGLYVHASIVEMWLVLFPWEGSKGDLDNVEYYFGQCGIIENVRNFLDLRKNLIITLFKNRHLGSTISGHFKTIRIEWTGSQKNFFFTQPHFSALDFEKIQYFMKKCWFLKMSFSYVSENSELNETNFIFCIF